MFNTASSRRRTIVAAFVLGLTAATLIGCRPAQPDRVFVEKRDLMSTTIALTIASPDEVAAKDHLLAAFDRLETLQSELNAHDPAAELAVVNSEGADHPVKVEADLFDAIAAGVFWYDRTNKVFDITIAPLLKVWRDCGKADRLPTQEELDAARALSGVAGITLDRAAQTVKLPRSGVQLDLGGLGKGFCMDRVMTLLRERGVKNALLAGSGDIYALGHNPQGRPWRVGVQDPRQPDNPDALLMVLALSDKAVSTSGNYQRYVTIQGKRYSHIVDPRTGWTADAVPSVTVIGPDATTTDILDTALSVMGLEEGMKFVEAHAGIEALFVTFDANNEPILTRSKGFSKYQAGWENKPK